MTYKPDFKLLGVQLTDSIDAVRRTGVETVEFGPGHATLRMPLAGNVNHVNMMYAGSLFSLAELPGGAVVLGVFDPAVYFPVVIELTIQYKKPAMTDITVKVSLSDAEIARISAELKERGKCVYILEQELKDTSGDVVATSKGVYQIRKF